MSEHHWRNEFTSNYFGSHLMPSDGKDMILTIGKVQTEDLMTTDGSVVQYFPKVEQPAFRKAMQNVKNMVVGYETKK